jgi:hypothetical protein
MIICLLLIPCLVAGQDQGKTGMKNSSGKVKTLQVQSSGINNNVSAKPHDAIGNEAAEGGETNGGGGVTDVTGCVPVPVPTITGPGTACSGYGGYIYVTEPGMTNYLWSVSSGGSITSGGGTSSIMVSWDSPGARTVSVNYTNSSGCTAPSPTVYNVSVDPSVTVGITIAVSANPICAGTSVTFTSNITNGGASPQYQWKLNGINVGTNSPTFTYTPSTNGDQVMCQLTSGIGCTTGNPVNSNTITMVMNPVVPVSVSISSSANPVCQGTSVMFTATVVNGGSAPAYLWKVNGSTAGTNSSTYSYTPNNGDIITCTVTSNSPCVTGNPATSNPLTMSVSSSLPVSVTITPSANPSCQGAPVTFTTVPVNGGSNPSYQWKVNGNSVIGSGPAYTYVPINGDVVSCVLSSNASCTTGNPATSNLITMSILQSVPVSVSVVASANPICQGTSVIFTATPVNGGSSPTYQWNINGFNVGTNNPSYTYTPANGDIITCRLYSNAVCPSGSPAVSAPVTMSVSPNLPVSVSIAASSNPVCVQTSVTFTATPFNGGSSPVYVWTVNGQTTGTNSPTLTFIPNNGDSVSCQMTSNVTCGQGNPATSNSIMITVSPDQLVGVSIAASANPVCQDLQVAYTATPTNGGPSPSYQWKVNGATAGTNSSVFLYTPVNNDVITCVMTSNATCTTGNPATSNGITMTVIPSQSVPVSITIVASANPSCAGQTVTYTATPVNGGGSPAYQWIVNGLNVGTNSPTYSYTPNNGDFIKCMLTSSITCATGNPATSNQVAQVVNPNLPVSVSIVCSPNPSCQGSSVTCTATAVNPGSAPVYQWKVNGTNVGINQNVYSFVPSNGNVVTCQLTSSVACPVTNPVTSNSVTLTVNPVTPVSVSIATLTNPSCSGSQVSFAATPVNGGTAPVYQWKVDGINSGSNNQFFVTIPLQGNVITCQMTSNAMCYSGSRTVLSNAISMVVSGELEPAITIAASANPFCQGSTVTFTATPVNGGTLPVYQWKVNCQNVGTNSPTLNYIPADGDFVTCQITSNLTCAIHNPAISNAITMKVNTSTPASVSIAASADPVCPGISVTYTATAVNGGTTPAFQWYVNGTSVGTNNPSFTYSPTNGDMISCKLFSNAVCVSGSPAVSNTVTATVAANLPAGVSISTQTNPFCFGTPVTLTATPVNGGSSPVYTWMVNSMTIGLNVSSYTYTPSDGDVITCHMTSNLACSTGNPAVSNTVTLVSATTLPVSVSITATETTICQGTPVKFTASPVNQGDNPVYLWKVNGATVGTNSLTYSYTPANDDVVSCMLSSSMTCSTGTPATSNSITMTVNPVLPVSVVITPSCNPCCLGVPVTLTATPTNGGLTPTYAWKVNCVPVGTNSSTYTYTPVNGDVIVCVVTSSEPCKSGSPAISNNVNMIVLPILPVSLVIQPSVNPFCQGSNVTFTATPTNGGLSPIFQWKVNGVNVGINQPSFTYAPLNGDTVTCQLTSSSSCLSNNPALSLPVIMTAITNLPVTINITPSSNPLCQGTLVAFTTITTNAGQTPTYQWKINGTVAGSNSPSYQYYPVNGDIVTCNLSSSLSCATPNPATSNSVSMTVYPTAPVSISIVASPNPCCQGATVNFTATPVNPGTTPLYQWTLNGVNVGISSTAYSYSNPANGDVIKCRLISNATCRSGNPATSNTITMSVSTSTPAGVSIAASANPVCQGTAVTFTATPVNGGTAPVYLWKVNGNTIGTSASTMVYNPVNGDVVTCQMTSNSPCITVNTANSNAVNMTVSPIQPVSISVSPSENPTCVGSSVTFTATPVNGGTIPVYQWKVNGLTVGPNSPAYMYVPSNNDVITCKLTSNATCTSGNPATSPAVTMTVSQSLPASISIASSSNPACQGQAVNYTALGINGGINPVYLWKVNGIIVGTNSPAFSYSPSNSDFVECQLTSSFSCATGSPANSNVINMTVNQNVPVSISITSSGNPVCEGTSVTFTAAPINGGLTPGYQWKVNGLSVGTSNPSYTYTPVNGDVITCLMTSSASCPTVNPVLSNPISMTVIQPLPAGISISASNNPICQGGSVTFTATPSNGGSFPVFQWKVNGNTVGANLPTFSYIPQNGDVVTCDITSTASCVTTPTSTSNPITMVVSSDLPVSLSISASANPGCQGLAVTFTANPVNGGSSPTYQWMVNGIIVGSNSLTFTYFPTNGDAVNCIMTSDFTCASGNPAISNTILMGVNQSVPVSVSVAVSANPVCLGSAVTFTATAVNGGSDPVYQWYVNGNTAGTNLSVFTYSPANGDVVTCELTSNIACVYGNPASSNPIHMVVSTDLPVAITISTPVNPICQGIPVTFTSISTYGGSSPVYSWKVNGVSAGSNNPAFTYIPSDGDVVTCTLTSNLPCATGSPAASNPITMVVNPTLPAGVLIEASLTGTICAGTPVTLTATPSNGGSPVYQWYCNSLPVGSNQPTLTYSPVNGDIVHVVMTSSYTCASGNPASSNTITMAVETPLPVSVTILPDQNNICNGAEVTLTATPVNGGTSSYQWYVNGATVGSNLPVYSFAPQNGDQVKVVMTSSLGCISGSPAISNVVTLTVNPILPVSVTVSADQNNICDGTTVTFTATPVNGGNPSYQWYVNGNTAGSNLSALSYIPSNGDQVYAIIHSDLQCISGSPAASNTVTMTVIPVLPVSVSIGVDQNNICAGTSVIFTATPVNGGVSTFHWFVNGIEVGTNAATYSYIPSNGDQVHVVAGSNLLCVSGNPATSNTITMLVNPILPVSVSVTADQNNICDGTSVTFTATAVNGGTPSYQWYVNGNTAGTNLSTYSYNPVNGDQVYVVLSSGLSCVTGNPATSNTVNMVVNPILPVSVSLGVDLNNVCAGTQVTFTATPVNGGVPAYHWYVNGNSVGSNLPTFSYTPVNGDQVYVIITSNLQCISGSPSTSNTVIMTVNPILPVSVSLGVDQNNVCAGTQVTFTATPVNGGVPVYQWHVNGNTVGSNQPSYSYIPVNGDHVYVSMTSTLNCISGSPANSNVITLTVNPILPASVSVAVDQNSICAGTTVTFTATPTNGGTALYQWYRNGVPEGTNSTTFTYIPVNGDQVYVVMTSGMTCISGSPATSNTVTMAVNPILPVSVAITVNQNNICAGTSVTFTATPVNGGIPTYQWFVNGSTAGTNQATFTFTPLNGDQVHVMMNSNLQCISGSPATSNSIIMTVNPILPVSVSVAVDQNNICNGTPVTFTATTVNGGTPAYQWYVNGSTAGSNQSTFSYTPVNGDQVYVKITSSLACISGSPATSNVITMTVNPILPVSVTISVSQNNICAGTSVTFTASPVNGGTANYQWYKNGVPAGTNSSTFSYIPVNGDQVYVVITSGLTCVSGNPATSNTITMVVNPIMPVSVSVSASQNNVCAGTSVTFTATPVNGGTPTYLWYVNGATAGSNLSTYTYNPVNGDQVYVIMTSNLQCVSGSPATSNTITMTVNPLLPVSVSIVASQNNICTGTSVTFTATPVNGGAPSYMWYVNGSTTGTNLPTLTYSPVNGDQVYVVVTSSLPCISGSPATSNTITMTVNPILPVSVSILVDQNNICEGTSVTFTASPVNGGTPTYQWYENSVAVPSATLGTYTTVPDNGDQVYVVMTSSLQCISGSPATSNTITMNVIQIVPASVTIDVSQNAICEGNTVTFTAYPVNGGTPAYQWYENSVAVPSATQNTYITIPDNGDQVYVMMTSSLQCVSGNPATSGTITMTVYLLPGAAGPISGPAEVCSGDEGVTYSVAAIPNAGSYTWSVPAGATIVSGNNTPAITVNFPVVPGAGAITVYASNTCGNGAISPAFAVTVNPYPDAPVITLDGQLLTSNAPAGNQWYKDGTAIPGATNPTFNVTQTGWYWSVVTLNGCSSDTSNHIYAVAVGIEEISSGPVCSVFPIPNDGRFTLDISLPSEETFSIFICSNLGTRILELKDVRIKGRFKKTFDLRPLPDGIYMVFISGGYDKFVRKILVKN